MDSFSMDSKQIANEQKSWVEVGTGGKQGYSPFSIHVCVVSHELSRTDFTSRWVRTAAK